MKTFIFNKEKDGRWYVELPEWPGNHAELEMVAGADTLLEKLANGKRSVNIELEETGYVDVKRLIKKTQAILSV